MRTFLFPARHTPLPHPLLQGAVISTRDARTWGEGAQSLFAAAASFGTVADLSITSMDDDGMWIWAGILTTVGLVASYVLAVAWQKWRDRKKEDAR